MKTQSTHEPVEGAHDERVKQMVVLVLVPRMVRVLDERLTG